MSIRTLAGLCLVCTAFAISGSTVQAQAFTFERILDETTLVPDSSGEGFAFFGGFSVDGDAVYFTARTDAGRDGLFRRDTSGGIGSLIYLDEVPHTASIPSFAGISADDGNVAFAVRDGGSASGIYALNNGSLTTIADTNTIAPGTSVTFRSFSPQVSTENGNVAFIAIDENFRQGVYTNLNGSLEAVITGESPLPGDPLVGLADRFSHATLDGGAIAFSAENYNNGREAIVRRNGSEMEVIASRTEGGFISFSSLDTAGAQVAFVGTLIGGTQGVFTNLGSQGSLVAVTSTSGSFEGLENVSSLDAVAASQGSTVFSAADASQGTRGVYTDLGGAIQKVLAPGDVLDGKIVRSAGFSGDSFEGGQIGMSVQFNDLSRAIYLATYAPPPGSALIDEGGDGSGSVLGGTQHLGGIDFVFENSSPGQFTTTFSISSDAALLNPGIQSIAENGFQIWDLDFIPNNQGDEGPVTPFDSVLFTLRYDPSIIDGELAVFHQLDDGSESTLARGYLGFLEAGQFAIAGDGLLQVRLPHFSDLVLTGTRSGGVPPPNSVPEPSSMALAATGLLGLLGIRRRRRREQCSPV